MVSAVGGEEEARRGGEEGGVGGWEAYPARSWTAYHWPSLHLRGSTMQRSKIRSAPLLQMSAAYSGTMTQHASVCLALVRVITGFTTGFTCNFVRILMRLSKLLYLIGLLVGEWYGMG